MNIVVPEVSGLALMMGADGLQTAINASCVLSRHQINIFISIPQIGLSSEITRYIFLYNVLNENVK